MPGRVYDFEFFVVPSTDRGAMSPGRHVGFALFRAAQYLLEAVELRPG